MRCLAVCQTELVVRMLETALASSFELEFLVESRALARRLHEAGLQVVAGNPQRTDTYLKADLSPNTCIIVEDGGRPGLRKTLAAMRDAGGTLVYVLGTTAASVRREDEIRALFPEVAYLSLAELFGVPLVTEVSRSLTRARVQQYQRYFADADRVLILLHNDPDPDAMASGLALRNILRRTKATAILGTLQGVTRPENLRMANLLDIQVESITPASVGEFDRIALVDVQPHYFGELLDRVDLVIDHHPHSPATARSSATSVPTTGPRPRSSPSTCARWTSTSRSAPRPRCCTPSSRTRCSSTEAPTAWTWRRSRSSTRWRTPP